MITRDEILRSYADGAEAVVALVAGLLAAQEAEVAALTARIQALEDRLAKDSQNSHLPPSRDLPPKPKSLRQPSGRKPGGQPGHRGTTLAWSINPEYTIVHQPVTCVGCGAALTTATVVGDRHRQVVDLPLPHLETTEQVVEQRRCAACGQVTQATFPSEACGPVSYGPRLRGVAVYLTQYQLLPAARSQALLADLYGCSFSVGTLDAAVAECAAVLAATETTIQHALRQAPVAHFDETGLRVAGTQQWVHVASTAQLTHYAVHPRRGAVGMAAAGVLPGFGGVAVHDGLHGYRTFACGHALCNVHHLRELTFIAEQYHQAWAGEGKKLLQELHQAVATARAAGQDHLDPATVTRAHQRYRAVARAGLAANPPQPKAPGAPGPPKRSPGGKLAERLGRYETETLGFLQDFRVPFDNNQAERDLRMIKVQQKISGGFRTSTGAARFTRIRGYLSTARKQSHSPLTALQTVFTGRPLVLTT